MLPFLRFFCYTIYKDARQQTGVGNFNKAVGLAAYRNGSEKNIMYGGWLSFLWFVGNSAYHQNQQAATAGLA